MAQPVDFAGFTHDFGPPPGEEERCGRLKVFMNGSCVVSAWQFSEEEWAQMSESRTAFISVWSGVSVFPVFVGSESVCASVVADHGKVWDKRGTAVPTTKE